MASKVETHSCKHCGKIFRQKHKLEQHLTVHNEIFTCEICKKSFERKISLQMHKTVHGVGKSFLCIYCLKIFESQPALSEHVRFHTGDKAFRCRYCRSEFQQSCALYKHYGQRHLDLPLYPCVYCGEVIVNIMELTAHLRSHSVECNYCGKEFREMSSLKNHNKMNLELRNWFCLPCQEIFTAKCAFMKHKDVHRRLARVKVDDIFGPASPHRSKSSIAEKTSSDKVSSATSDSSANNSSIAGETKEQGKKQKTLKSY